jgi:phosphoesterase RecJ-like protein
MKKIVNEILKIFKKNNNFFITGHIRPDGDTIGSELAIASWLKKNNKNVEIAHTDKLPDNLLFLSGTENIIITNKIDKEYEVGIIFECPDTTRMKNIIDLNKLKKIISIDHHPTEFSFGHINLINTKVSSCAELVYTLMRQSKYVPNLNEAICLYVGLVTDTGKFQQMNTTSNCLKIASELVKIGVNPAEIYRNIYGKKTVTSAKILAKALETLNFEDGICYMWLSDKINKDIQNVQLTTDDIINYAGLISDTKIYVLFSEFKDKGIVKVSLRSYDDNIDLNKIASKFGGGGHKHASGCEIKGSLNKIKQEVLEYLKKCI